MSRRPSAFRSGMRKCRPTPLSVWITCLIQRPGRRRGPFRTSRGPSARTNRGRGRYAPGSVCRDEVHQAVAVHVGQVNGMCLRVALVDHVGLPAFRRLLRPSDSVGVRTAAQHILIAVAVEIADAHLGPAGKVRRDETSTAPSAVGPAAPTNRSGSGYRCARPVHVADAESVPGPGHRDPAMTR